MGFQPIYSFEVTKSGQLPYRIAIALSFFSFFWWAVTQPSEFDTFVKEQKEFMKGISEQLFLPVVSQQEKDNIDKPKIQPLDELLKRLEEEEQVTETLSEEEQINILLDD